MFVYTISRCVLSDVGVMLTIVSIILLEISDVSSVPLSSLTAKEFNITSQVNIKNYTLAFNQHFVRTHNSDHILLRLVVVFVGVVLVFAMLICLCTMYWCFFGAFQWSSTLPNTHMSRSRFRSNKKQSPKDLSSTDLPPAYEVILANQEDEASTRAATVRNANTETDEEQPPPTYVDVLNNKYGAS